MKTFMEQCGNIFTTQAVIKKWGNSQGIRLSKELMSHMDLKENDTIGINVCGRKMIIERKATAIPLALDGGLR